MCLEAALWLVCSPESLRWQEVAPPYNKGMSHCLAWTGVITLSAFENDIASLKSHYINSIITIIINYYWSFIRKDLCEARAKPHSVFKFSDNLSALSQMYPSADEDSGQVDIWPDFGSGWSLDRCTPICPGRDILWPSVILLWVRLIFGQTLGQVDLWSDIPPAKTSCDQVWYYFRLGWHLVTSLGQVDLCCRCTPRMRFWVRLTFGQTLGQVDLWSDIPPAKDILWPSVILLQVRLTFGHIFGSGWPLFRCTPQDKALGQVDIWSDFWSG